MKTFFIYLLTAFPFFAIQAQKTVKHTLSGYVKDAKTGEALIGAVIAIPAHNTGTAANTYGYYSLTLEADSIEVVYSSFGYHSKAKKISFNRDIVLNVELEPSVHTMEEVVVTTDKARQNVEKAQMGVIDIPIKQIKELPAIGGEKDLLKAIQLLPGVQSGGEASAGFYVRGGGPDQNMILLDEAVVYNPFHLFGFFSIFNPDAIKNFTLYKGGFPSQYGGRLSSIIDISLKEGNNKTYHAEGGIGIISSKLTVEGPIIKDKASFMISGRRTYADLIIAPFMEEGERYAPFFYDLNTKLNFKISENDRLFISGYFGKDVFLAENKPDSTKFQVDWGNKTTTIRWNHLFGSKLFSNTTFLYNDYAFRIAATLDDLTAKLYSGIQDLSGKVDFEYYPHVLHKVKFGGIYTYHTFVPASVKGKSEDIEIKSIQQKETQEMALYINDEYTISDKLSVNGGIRLPSMIYKTTRYFDVEPRISGKYSLDRNTSVKAGITKMNQYIHLITNSTASTPMDLWIPSSDTVKPQISWQYAAGIFKNFKNDEYEANMEIYYKTMKNQIEYKPGADIFFNKNIQQELVFGKGWSYGSEWFLKKNGGKVNGWVGYTLSWTYRLFPDIQATPYPAKYDRRHDLEMAGFYELNKKWSFSAVFVYGSGHSITLAQGKYYDIITGRWVDDYVSKNGYKLKAYNRMDIGIRYKIKPHRKWESSWSFDIYNVYNRRNPYFVYTSEETDEQSNVYKTVLKQVSLFPVIPSFTYNFKF